MTNLNSTEQLDGNAATAGGGISRPPSFDHAWLRARPFAWRRPYVTVARLVFNACYRAWRQEVRANEVVFISRQSDKPRYDFSMLAREFEERGWRVTMLLKKVRMRNLAGYVGHVLTEIRLLGRCKVAILDRYDPVVSLIDFECEGANGNGDALEAVKDESLPRCANLDFPRQPIVLQMWHAFGAYKKFGYQTVDTPEGHSGDFTRDWRIHRNNTWVVCSGEDARAGFAEAFSVPIERVVPLNRPEYDKLVNRARGAARPKHGASLPAAGDRPTDPSAGVTGARAAAGESGASAGMRASREGSAGRGEGSRLRVLMAPTLRKSPDVPHPMRDLYAIRDVFEPFVDADFKWAFHPLEEGLPAPGDVSRELLECDVVVTDYSSLVYEAHLLGKMVLFYVPDIDSYRLTPGLNHDPLDLAPGLCSRDEGELVVRLQALADDSSSYPDAQLGAFIGRSFEAPRNGTVASRIVDFLTQQA